MQHLLRTVVATTTKYFDGFIVKTKTRCTFTTDHVYGPTIVAYLTPAVAVSQMLCDRGSKAARAESTDILLS